jgi:8-oxo-dGTP pyrophosphatase MutT (NUDIX family)
MKEKILIVVANILEKKGKFLLVRERKRVFAGKKIEGKWNLPAGRLERESLIKCLIRETKEETGFDVKPSYLIGIYQYPQIFELNVIFFVFSSKISKGKFKPTKEIEKIGWFSFKEIENLQNKGELRGDYILEAIKDYKRKTKIPIRLVKVLKFRY